MYSSLDEINSPYNKQHIHSPLFYPKGSTDPRTTAILSLMSKRVQEINQNIAKKEANLQLTFREEIKTLREEIKNKFIQLENKTFLGRCRRFATFVRGIPGNVKRWFELQIQKGVSLGFRQVGQVDTKPLDPKEAARLLNEEMRKHTKKYR